MGKKKKNVSQTVASSIPQAIKEQSAPLDYGKIRVGLKPIEDILLNLQTVYDRAGISEAKKTEILRAIADGDLSSCRDISNLFFATSGIYKSACEHLAYLYKYDYYMIPRIDEKGVDKNKILTNFYKNLRKLDNSNIKEKLSKIALKVIKDGCYYGYIGDNKESLVLQDLPIEYCRSRYYYNERPTVEFNMEFFDRKFTDASYRMRVLKAFPEEFQKGYNLYKQGKLVADRAGDKQGWYLLDPMRAYKFNMNENDMPYLISAIPAILELNEAQELEKRKTAQDLMKLIIQKLPTDKNGELLFDPDEAKDLHDNGTAMLKGITGANIFTTFADTKVESLTDRTTTTSADDLIKNERTAFNELTISQSLFNATGNTALTTSISQDGNKMRPLLYQFQDFLTNALTHFGGGKKNSTFMIKILETTGFNYQDVAKAYKEQIQYGYSKMLPQIALGHSQSEVLSELYFETEVLDLQKVMVPATSGNTLSGKSDSESGEGAGRKALPDDQKSDKTLKNLESIG